MSLLSLMDSVDEEGGPSIVVQVVRHDSEDAEVDSTTMRVKESAPLGDLFDSYVEDHGLQPKAWLLVYHGCAVDRETPRDLRFRTVRLPMSCRERPPFEALRTTRFLQVWSSALGW